MEEVIFSKFWENGRANIFSKSKLSKKVVLSVPALVYRTVYYNVTGNDRRPKFANVSKVGGFFTLEKSWSDYFLQNFSENGEAFLIQGCIFKTPVIPVRNVWKNQNNPNWSTSSKLDPPYFKILSKSEWGSIRILDQIPDFVIGLPYFEPVFAGRGGSISWDSHDTNDSNPGVQATGDIVVDVLVQENPSCVRSINLGGISLHRPSNPFRPDPTQQLRFACADPKIDLEGEVYWVFADWFWESNPSCTTGNHSCIFSFRCKVRIVDCRFETEFSTESNAAARQLLRPLALSENQTTGRTCTLYTSFCVPQQYMK